MEYIIKPIAYVSKSRKEIEDDNNRPNKLGFTTVELLEHNHRKLIVKGFDAIDGTPIIDIKRPNRLTMHFCFVADAPWSSRGISEEKIIQTTHSTD
ncbi:hypothetical protein PMSD_06225 [Paenibacillus macquariensis subsp. defensor]|nr:hypothetical protein PMSD_06225 [Paenibacillus macquariensis subsp. defensor]